MIDTESPPKICERILDWLAPQALCEDLLGDLEEEFNGLSECSHAKATIRYIENTLRLIPFLLLVRLSEVRSSEMLLQLLAIITFLCVLISWELILVQNQAWPITAKFMEVFLLSAKGLYFSVYTFLFFFAIGAIYCFNSTALWMQKGLHLHPGILAVILTLVPLLGVFYPQPLDSYLMRMLHILAIWTLANLTVTRNNAK